MPWCDDCDRFYNPNTLDAQGTCPSGHHVADAPGVGVADAGVTDRGVTDSDGVPEKLRRFSDEPAPWHFKVLLAVTGVYIGFRLLQMAWWGAEWLVNH